ncbi:MAG TPA: hypothetical protein PKD53_04340 [Chloroflexaceae bacterium]|nr:hypothetical protein [Chloroflexaceae bacterium]
MADDELGALDALEEPAELDALGEEQLPFELDAAGMPADLLAEEGALEETAAALGLVEIPDLPGDEPDQAWDEAASAVAAQSAPPADEAWDDAARALDTAETPIVDTAPITPEEAQAEAAPPEPLAPPAEGAVEGEEDEEEVIDPINFGDEEWAIFTTMMRGFTKPASFQQIFDTLRGQRKEHGMARTNEQLRTMVKQAINSGLLERSGRGKRVYYALKAE